MHKDLVSASVHVFFGLLLLLLFFLFSFHFPKPTNKLRIEDKPSKYRKIPLFENQIHDWSANKLVLVADDVKQISKSGLWHIYHNKSSATKTYQNNWQHSFSVPYFFLLQFHCSLFIHLFHIIEIIYACETIRVLICVSFRNRFLKVKSLKLYLRGSEMQEYEIRKRVMRSQI